MKATPSANRPTHTPITLEAQAAALWMFVRAKAPRFTLESARDVIARLGLQPGEAPKPLAKRLRAALETHRVTLKHTNALQAASRLAGFESWHENTDEDIHRLKFVTIDSDKVHETPFRSWNELATELRSWADRLLARGQLPLGVLSLNFTGNVLSLTTPVPPAPKDAQLRNQPWPLGVITPMVDDPQWLDGGLAALEKLRRHLEENGHAVLEGYAVLRLCATSYDEVGHPMAMTVSDVANSELVLMREDNEDDPQSGYEIARGDELACWHQIELSLRKESKIELPSVQITVPSEGGGAWHVNGIRYVWAVETLKPKAYVPGRVNRQIGTEDCERLLRRYNLAKRIHGKSFKHHEPTKRVDYLGAPLETCRVDLHFMLRELSKTGLNWDSYIEKFGAEPLPMTDQLPIGFLFQFLENMLVDKPNQVFARPNLSEMVRCDDDGLLRALMPRVEHVRYMAPKDLDVARANDLRSAVDEFAGSLHTQKMLTGGGMQMEDELPHLVWATDAEDIRLAADTLGLVMYAATVPHLIAMEGLVPQVPGIKSWPWAFGNALYFRFVDAGGAQ